MKKTDWKIPECCDAKMKLDGETWYCKKCGVWKYYPELVHVGGDVDARTLR